MVLMAGMVVMDPRVQLDCLAGQGRRENQVFKDYKVGSYA